MNSVVNAIVLVLTVIGLSYGDEGKGQTVLRLLKLLLKFIESSKLAVARFGGGPNAGHTVIVDDEKNVSQQLPSGIFLPGVKVFLGQGMVLDLPLLKKNEIEPLGLKGFNVSPERIRIDKRASVIWGLPKKLEGLSEAALGADSIGSTKKGIGSTVAALANRFEAIFVEDLLYPEDLQQKIEQIVLVAKKYYRVKVKKAEVAAWVKELIEIGEFIRPYVADVGQELAEFQDAGGVIVAEGAQGALLDVRCGTTPFVTSCSPLAQSAPLGLRLAAKRFGKTIGIIKAYVTRVGNGPFVTKDTGLWGRFMAFIGKELGAITGRPRDCGFFDAVAARYAILINEVDAIYLTKLDVLSTSRSDNPELLDKIKICNKYRNSVTGREVEHMPTVSRLSFWKPVNEEMDSWHEDISTCRSFEELPVAAQNYVRRLEELMGVPIVWIGVGETDKDEIIVRPEFSLLAD